MSQLSTDLHNLNKALHNFATSLSKLSFSEARELLVERSEEVQGTACPADVVRAPDRQTELMIRLESTTVDYIDQLASISGQSRSAVVSVIAAAGILNFKGLVP